MLQSDTDDDMWHFESPMRANSSIQQEDIEIETIISPQFQQQTQQRGYNNTSIENSNHGIKDTLPPNFKFRFNESEIESKHKNEGISQVSPVKNIPNAFNTFRQSQDTQLDESVSFDQKRLQSWTMYNSLTVQYSIADPTIKLNHGTDIYFFSFC